MRFLLAADGSVGAQTALEFLAALPLAGSDHVTVLTVPAYSFVGTAVVREGPDLLHDTGVDAARAIAERARERLARHGVSVRADVLSGPVADVLQVAAIEDAADVVVLGSRGLGTFSGTILGSVARALARHASVSVLVVRERRLAPSHVLVAIDGSQEAWAAVKLLARLPLPADVPITLLELPSAAAACRWPVLDEAQTLLSTHPIELHRAAAGHLVDQILTRGRAAGVDLVVLGSRGMTTGGGALQGSVADQVLSQAHCAVLVAKPQVKPSLVTEPHAFARTAVAL